MATLGSRKSHKLPQEGRAPCLQLLEKQHVGDAGHLSGQSHQTTAAQRAHPHPALVETAKHFNEETDFPLSNSQKVQTLKTGVFLFVFLLSSKWFGNGMSFLTPGNSQANVNNQCSILKKASKGQEEEREGEGNYSGKSLFKKEKKVY